MVHNVGIKNQIVHRVQVLDLRNNKIHSIIDFCILLSFGLIVQKGKFSAGTLDLVKILKNVDFLENKTKNN
jgi:hypothetical protein